MKLSREGAARLGCHEARGFPVSDFEFKPEDFDGCCQNGKDHLICLTVKEIFTFKQMVKWVLKSSSLGRTNTVFLEEAYKILNKHFKQAEKGNETK